MFDISEYYKGADNDKTKFKSIPEIENEISDNIDDLLKNRFENLYVKERYKTKSNIIEIISPKIFYGNRKSLILTPDKIKSQLSLYPEKKHLNKIKKIVFRPKNIQIGNTELSALYLRNKKILVLYLTYPHTYPSDCIGIDLEDEFILTPVETIFKNTLHNNSTEEKVQTTKTISPLWYFLSHVLDSKEQKIDKFFVQKENTNNQMNRVIDDISFYYSRHGY